MTAPETEEVYEFQCADCEALFDEQDAGSPVYECSRCGETFTRDDSADGDSSRCPNCMIFSAKVADVSCPECGSGEPPERGEFHPPPPPTAEEVAEAEERRARSDAQMEVHRQESARRRAEQRARWEGPDGLARVLAPFGIEEELLNTLGSDWASQSMMMTVQVAEDIARFLLEREPRPDVRYLETATRTAPWVRPEGLSSAFGGLPGEFLGDLALSTQLAFGRDGAVATSFPEATWAALAERVREKAA